MIFTVGPTPIIQNLKMEFRDDFRVAKIENLIGLGNCEKRGNTRFDTKTTIGKQLANSGYLTMMFHVGEWDV